MFANFAALPHDTARCDFWYDGPGRAGLGPSPGWGPYGPIRALMGPYGSSWTGLGASVNFP